MTKTEALAHFKSVKKLASACGVTKSAVSQWKDDHIPLGQQYRLEIVTKGKLKAERKQP